jgi:WD40 repeat protein
MESSDSNQSDIGFVSYGVRELRVWENIRSRFPVCRRGHLGDVGVLQTFLTCEVFAGSPNVGTTDGNIYVFESNFSGVMKHAVKAHIGAVTAMHCSRSGPSGSVLMVTGGRDGAVRLWNKDHECLKELMVEALLPSCHSPRVRSVAFSVDGSKVAVGTKGGEIFEISLHDGRVINNRAAVESHGMRELCGIASHPTREEFVTAGDDCTIRFVV